MPTVELNGIVDVKLVQVGDVPGLPTAIKLV